MKQRMSNRKIFKRVKRDIAFLLLLYIVYSMAKVRFVQIFAKLEQFQIALQPMLTLSDRSTINQTGESVNPERYCIEMWSVFRQTQRIALFLILKVKLRKNDELKPNP